MYCYAFRFAMAVYLYVTVWWCLLLRVFTIWPRLACSLLTQANADVAQKQYGSQI